MNVENGVIWPRFEAKKCFLEKGLFEWNPRRIGSRKKRALDRGKNIHKDSEADRSTVQAGRCSSWGRQETGLTETFAILRLLLFLLVVGAHTREKGKWYNQICVLEKLLWLQCRVWVWEAKFDMGRPAVGKRWW